MKFTPYWLDTSPAGPDRTSTEIGGEVDVAVVGAGLTGLSAALHLARKGAKVAVFERDTVAFGASGRNGGMATTGLSIGFRDEKLAPNVELAPFDRTFTSVYEQDLGDGTVFHFSLLENALTVPITIVIPQEKIEADFPNMEPSSLELYNQYALEIDETSLGFQEYHPYKGYFIAEGKILKHYLPDCPASSVM